MLQETYGGIDRLSDAQIDEWRVKDSYFHPKSSRLGRDEWRAEVKRVLREECCLPTKVDLGDRKMYPYWYLVDLKSKEGGGDGDQDEEWEDVDGEDDEQEEEMAGSGPGGLESTPNRRQEPELEDSARSETSGSQPNSESSESVILPPPGYTLGRYAPWWADPAVLPPQEAAKGTTHPNLIKMTAWDINAWTKYNPDVFCDRETGYNDISTRARLHAKFNGTFMNQTEQDCKFWIKDGAAFDDKAEKYADWSTDDVKTHLDFYYGVGNYEDDGTDPSDDDDEGSLYSWPKRTGPGVGQGQENRAEEIEDGDDVDTGDLCYKSYHETTDAEDHFDHDVEMEDVEQAGGSSTKSNKTSTRKRVASDEEPEASPKRRKLS